MRLTVALAMHNFSADVRRRKWRKLASALCLVTDPSP